MNFVNVRMALGQPGQKHPSGNIKIAIYALYEPDDGGIRYIGMTRGPLKRRLAWHRKAPTNYSMARWLSSGCSIRIVALEYVPEREWEDAERGWIAWCRERGDLLNVDIGGAYRDRSGKARNVVLGTLQEPQRGGKAYSASEGSIPPANGKASKFWSLAYRPIGR